MALTNNVKIAHVLCIHYTITLKILSNWKYTFVSHVFKNWRKDDSERRRKDSELLCTKVLV